MIRNPGAVARRIDLHVKNARFSKVACFAMSLASGWRGRIMGLDPLARLRVGSLLVAAWLSMTRGTLQIDHRGNPE